MGFFERNRAALAERGIDPARLPPGQYSTDRFPVLHVGDVPVYAADRSDWSLAVAGLVGEPRTFSWADLLALPATDVVTDIHCVTKWSKFDTRWRGVRFRDLLAACGGPLPGATPRPRDRRVRLHHQRAAAGPARRRRARRVRVRRDRHRGRPRWPGPADGAAPLLLEVGEVAPAHRRCSTTTSPASGSATATTPTATRSSSSATADDPRPALTDRPAPVGVWPRCFDRGPEPESRVGAVRVDGTLPAPQDLEVLRPRSHRRRPPRGGPWTVPTRAEEAS